MKSHNWILPAGKHARIGPATRLAENVCNETPAQTARAVLVLALVAGGVGSETVLASASTTSTEASIIPSSSTHAVAHPWAF
jgi:hypothetical protein